MSRETRIAGIVLRAVSWCALLWNWAAVSPPTVGNRREGFMIRIAAYAVGTIVATLIVAQFAPRYLSFDSANWVIVFGLVTGAINAFIKPVVKLLTLPITCLTFGLFAIVVNAALFALGAALTPGIHINWVGALVGSILASLASGLIFSVVDE